MTIILTDLHQETDDTYPTLGAAMTAVLARYPEAVFSAVQWTEPTIWVWPSRAASQDGGPAQAVAWIHREEDWLGPCP
jgi:hypothetical protein